MNPVKPLIEIIVPVYNGAAYIEGFSKMMSAQKDDRVRFVFVDDGSTDESPQLLDKVNETYGIRTNVIHQPNGGVSAARNRGIKEAEALFIAFFDVDDICSEDYISSLLRLAGNENFDVAVFNRKMLYGDEKLDVFGDEIPKKVTNEKILKGILYDDRHFGFANNILVKREFLIANDLKYHEGYPYYEDADFLYRCVANSKYVMHLDRSIYGYVAKREGSAMSSFSKERLRCLELLKDLQKVFTLKAPDFAQDYARYGVARIYWSVLWQAALASGSFKDFREFAADSYADIYMRKLGGFPDRKVLYLRRLYLVSKRLYFLAAVTLGRKYTALEKADPSMLKEAAALCPEP